MSANIEDKADAVAGVCREFGVARLELFGSACTAEFDPGRSDLDFLVEFLPDTDLGPWLSRLFELRTALSQLYGRTVDLIMASALRDPWFRREAEKTRTMIYHAPQEPQMAS
jgi:predicted nucleotidyltransferase